jgi:hypothetical protein
MISFIILPFLEFIAWVFRRLRRRQGLLALDLGSIFEKLLHQKTFNFVTAPN